MVSDATSPDGMSERQLALWMLDKMAGSKEFIGVLRQARSDGERHFLDTEEVRAMHMRRLKKLHQGDTEEVVEVPAVLAGKIAGIVDRDLLSGPDELIEKAIEAYIERTGSRELPENRQPTLDMARAEVEGRTTGMFHSGFVAGLAGAAREEMARDADRDRDRGHGHERDV